MSGPYSQEEILRLLERQPGRDGVEETTTSSRVSAMALLSAGALRDVAGPLRYLLANLEYLDHQLSSHERDLPHGRAEELRQCLREAMLGAKRVRDIASDVPTPHSVRPADSHVDLHRVLLSCVKIARTEIEHPARIVTEFDTVPTIIGSESRISRLFLNIIVNAAQAVAGDVEKDHFIRIVTRNDAGRHIVVDIVDSGPGIPSENLERLFEPFFTTKPANQGTGLGLSICRKIVEDLGGRISVETTVGAGSTFRVILPVRAAERITDRAPPADGTFAPSPPPVRRLPLRQLG